MRTDLFRFTLTSAGRVASFSRIRTGRLPGFTEPSLAISPDGTQLALAGIPDLDQSIDPSGPPRLVVVNMRTGLARTWHGLAGTGSTDLIEDPVWMTDGSLRFVVATCRYRDPPYNGACAYSGPTGREWAVDVPEDDAPLGSGRVLVRLPGATVQAQSSGSGDSVTSLAVLDYGGIQVARYDVRQGHLLKILYRREGSRKSDAVFAAGLAADGSGSYLLINENLGSFFGWIGDGRFHKLQIHGLYGFDEIVAASW